jgi:hypothetical protein
LQNRPKTQRRIFTCPSKCICKIPLAAQAFCLRASASSNSSKCFVAVAHEDIISFGTIESVRDCRIYKPGGSLGFGGSVGMEMSENVLATAFLTVSKALSLLLAGSSITLVACCYCPCRGDRFSSMTAAHRGGGCGGRPTCLVAEEKPARLTLS